MFWEITIEISKQCNILQCLFPMKMLTDPQTITYSKSTVETVEKVVKSTELTKKDTRTTSFEYLLIVNISRMD